MTDTNTSAASQTSLNALTFLMGDDALRDRFLALSGLNADTIRSMVTEQEFQSNVLEFFIHNEADLLNLSQHLDINPDQIVAHWRALGGGLYQEW